MHGKDRARVIREVERNGDQTIVRRRVEWTEGGEKRSVEEQVTLEETGSFLALEEPENCRLNFK